MPAIREGRWDCRYCGTKGIRGRYKFCTQCGASRGEGIRFYPVAGEPPVTDANLVALASAGPDWVCVACESDNIGTSTNCGQCGAPKGTAKSHPVIEYSLADTPHSAEEAANAPHQEVASTYVAPVAADTFAGSQGDIIYHPDPVLSRDPATSATHSSISTWDPTPEPRRYSLQFEWRKPAIGLGIVAVIALVIFGLWAALHTTQVKATLVAVEWTRTVHIDSYMTVQESAWSVPYGGRQVSVSQQVHHYNHVVDHYDRKSREVADGSETYTCGSRDLGNGFFEDVECSRTTYRTEYYDDPVYRDDPVYAAYYVYDIEKWVPLRAVPTSGVNFRDPIPFWGEVVLNCNGQATIGCERESYREEHYYVTLRETEGEKPKEYRREVPRNEWDQYKFEFSYTLVVNSVGVQNNPLTPQPKQ